MTEEIGQLDEESAAIAAKSRLELASEWIEAVASEIVVRGQFLFGYTPNPGTA